jgi:predicted Zn-dependent protease
LNSSSYSSTEIKYVIALGHFKLGQNKECLKILNELLKVEPENQQFLELKNQAEDSITKGI